MKSGIHLYYYSNWTGSQFYKIGGSYTTTHLSVDYLFLLTLRFFSECICTVPKIVFEGGWGC